MVQRPQKRSSMMNQHVKISENIGGAQGEGV
jgi:hypothetical protein